MRIAVLADIHGNMTALEAVLDALSCQNIDKYIVAGDHISDCPNPDEVLDVILQLDGWIIKGNREEYVLEVHDKKMDQMDNIKQLASIVWTKNRLKPENISYIRSLPDQMSISFGSSGSGLSPENTYKAMQSIRLVHGSTDDIYEHLFSYKRDRIQEILSRIDEEVLVCAHTHEAWSSVINGKLVVNPGSLGVSFNEDRAAEYAILEWREGAWVVEHHRLQYSLDELERQFRQSGLYDEAGIWPRLILKSIKDGVNRYMEFIKQAQKCAESLGYKDYDYIPNEAWELTAREWRL